MRLLTLLMTLAVVGCQAEPAQETSASESAQEAAQGTAVESAPASDHEFYQLPGQDLGLPFSPAVRVGDLVFLSGQIGNLPGTLELAEGGLEAEARQTMENIKSTLAGIGLTMGHVIKCTVMIDDISQWGDFNAVYVDYFPGDKPARSAFGADGLALGAAVEVECLARAK